jgi:hypothetical protein
MDKGKRPQTPPRRIAPFAVALALGSLLATVIACSDPDGTTPTCVQDVGEGGIMPVDGGCTQFAVCLDDAGNAQNPKVCCPADAGDQAACLYGYGAGPPPMNVLPDGPTGG